MGRYDFQSPGAAFTGELTKLLAERKAEERQQLLDSLAVKADERAAQAAEQQRMMQTATLKSQEQQDEIARLGAATPFMSMGQDVSSMPDDILRTGSKYGAFSLQNEPEVSTEITGMQADGQELAPNAEAFGPDQASAAVASKAPPKWRYAGNPQERERERRKREIGNTLVGMLSSDNPDTKAAAESMAQMLGIFDEVPASAAGLLAPSKKIKQHDYGTGKITDTGQTIGPNDELIQRPWHPNYGQPKNLQPIGVDEKGQVVFTDPSGPKGNKQVFEGVYGRTTSANNSLGVPQGIWDNLNIAASALVVEDPWTGPPTIPEENISAYRQAATMALGSIKARMSPTVHNLALTAINDTTNYDSAVKQAYANGQLNNTDVNQLITIISSIVPPDKLILLKKYAPIKTTEPTTVPKSDLERVLLSQPATKR